MSEITLTYDSEYEVGDLVIFKKNKHLMVGIIEGFYVDSSANDSIWYNIRINKDEVFTYSNKGDISEADIAGVILDKDLIKIIKNDILYNKQMYCFNGRAKPEDDANN